MADAIKSRLPLYILVGAALGLAVGLFIGERAAVLQPLGIAYAKMLEIAVFPYLICSLLVGLGGLARGRAGHLLRASWGTYLVVWGLTFLTIFLLGVFIPPAAAPSVLMPEAQRGAADIIDLLIPANIAVALDRNFVPAVVVFAILYSIAIQALPQKTTFLQSMEVLRRASVTIWMWIVYFAPLGVFALFASTAGTVNSTVAGGLAVYTALFLLGTCVLGFVILPMLLSRLVPQSYGAILSELRPALTLALVTTLSVAALPFIQAAAEQLCRDEKVESEETNDVIRATVSLAYVFSQLGNYFIAFFLTFASYHERIALTIAQWTLLPVMTLLSGVGSPSASVDAVAFLAGWLHLPTGATNLYVETMTITRYGQVALSVIGFAFVTLLVTMIYAGRAHLRLRPVLGAFVATAGLFGAVAFGGRMFSVALFPPPTDAAIMARTLESSLTKAVDVIVHKTRPADLASLSNAATFDGIRARGRLRVGYGVGIIPFSYFNAAGELVGYDIATAYRFAHDLHVGIEFVPIDWTSLDSDLEARYLDIVMAAAYATPDRLRRLGASDFYLVNPVALIVRSDRAAEFLSYESIARRSGVHMAVLRGAVLEPLVQHLFPKARVTVIGSYDELPGLKDVDAAIWTRDQAAAWTSARSGFTAVVPSDIGAPLPFSYLLPPNSRDMLRYVDLWLQLQQTDGTRKRALDYWVEGAPRAEPGRRWNVIDDVLMPIFAR